MKAYRWVEDSPTVHRLFYGEHYVGKLFYTVVGGAVTDVMFVRAVDHARFEITLDMLVGGGARRAVITMMEDGLLPYMYKEGS